MNREEYMRTLGHRLKRLPREDYDKAMEYFVEYFEEAGPENEAQAIEDLGKPEAAADQLIQDYADEYAQCKDKDVRKNFSGVWVAILALFAAPVALPLALAVAAVGFSVVVVVASLIFSVFCVALCFAVAAIPGVLVGIWMLIVSPVNGIATLGLALITTGFGIWMCIASVNLCRWFLHMMTRIIDRIRRRGSK